VDFHAQRLGYRPGLRSDAGRPQGGKVQALRHGGKAPDRGGAGEHRQGLRVLPKLRVQVQGTGRLIHRIIQGQLPDHRPRRFVQLRQELPAALLCPRQPNPAAGFQSSGQGGAQVLPVIDLGHQVGKKAAPLKLRLGPRADGRQLRLAKGPNVPA